MTGWVDDIERATLENESFRSVLHTGEHTQLTVMSIPAGGEIGGEEGSPAETHDVGEDWAVIVPAGEWHDVVNTGSGALKLDSLYSPPEHPDGTVHRTRADADAAER